MSDVCLLTEIWVDWMLKSGFACLLLAGLCNHVVYFWVPGSIHQAWHWVTLRATVLCVYRMYVFTMVNILSCVWFLVWRKLAWFGGLYRSPMDYIACGLFTCGLYRSYRLPRTCNHFLQFAPEADFFNPSKFYRTDVSNYANSLRTYIG